MFAKNEPMNLTSEVLRDTDGIEYVAHCPPRYKALRFFDMGKSWRVTEVECAKSHERYLLKNLKNEKCFFECYAIANICGVLFKDYHNEQISVPKVIEAGYTEHGANYVIEEQKFGIHATPTIVKSLPERERAKFDENMGRFLFRLHKSLMAAKFVDALPPESRPQDVYMEGRHYVKLIRQNYSLGWPLSIVHGDLAPRNVLIDNFGRISILDWGEAHLDYAFVEFDRAYHDMYGFGGSIIDGIADKYCRLREDDYNIMKRETPSGRGERHAVRNPRSRCKCQNYRLPKYLRQKQH
jgi:serine/threonine protein kinase